jgi:hypothetical protein
MDESMVEDSTMVTEDEMRLVSSDLEDCQEVWMSELSDYILETRKRHREVEAFYKLTVIVSFLMFIFSGTYFNSLDTGARLKRCICSST